MGDPRSLVNIGSMVNIVKIAYLFLICAGLALGQVQSMVDPASASRAIIDSNFSYLQARHLSGTGAPTGTCTIPSFYSRSDTTGLSQTIYVCRTSGSSTAWEGPLLNVSTYATSSTPGSLSAADWSTFFAKAGTGSCLVFGQFVTSTVTGGVNCTAITAGMLPGSVVLTAGAYTDPSWLTLTQAGGRITGFEVPLTFTAPLTRTTNTITCGTATGSVAGCLSAADWTTFNAKQAALTLTTTGSSGAATLIGSTLNIPQYSGGGSTVITATAGLGGVTAGLGVVKDTSNPTAYIAATSLAVNCVYVGIATTSAAQGAPFQLQVTRGLVNVTADNAITAGHYVGCGTSTAGMFRDLGLTINPISNGVNTYGVAMASAIAGASFSMLYDGVPTRGATVDTVSGLTVATGKTLSINNSLTIAGTDGTVMTFPTTSATLARIDAANIFAGVQKISNSNVASTLIMENTSSGGIVDLKFFNSNSSVGNRIGMNISAGSDTDSLEVAVNGTVVVMSVNKAAHGIGIGPRNFASGFSNNTLDVTDKTVSTGATRFSVGLGAADSAGTVVSTVAGTSKTVHIVGNGTAPTITSGFGSTPALVNASDLNGTVTIGTGGSANTGLITFGVPFTAAPSCFAEDGTTALKLQAITTTTTLTINSFSPSVGGGYSATAFGAGDTVRWWCGGG